MQLLLYATTPSPRLEYTCHFIFKEILAVDFLISTDLAIFKNHDGPKIKYTNEAASGDHYTIGNCGLLFEKNIKQQVIQCFEVNDYKAFYKTENADFPFDIFASSFYLLSRYEEYLPYKKDSFGRYAHENSLAFRENFLHLPLINIWVNHFMASLQKAFPGLIIQHAPFSFIPTYDIDMAFSFKHKGWLRNTGGFFNAPSFKRIKVLLGFDKDPFDSFEWLTRLHNAYNLQPLYFFLLAVENGRYDKNILPHKGIMRKLIQQHAGKYAIGIHPSWQSGDNPALLAKEKETLEAMSATWVTNSRQHYIRFTLPTGYRHLTENGILDDYSMGYGSINGFRASVASSFYWYDLQKNESTLLRIHPFCYMEANSFYEQKYNPEKAYDELLHYFLICKSINGQLITIWHNNFLGTDPQFAGWREIYQQFVYFISKTDNP